MLTHLSPRPLSSSSGPYSRSLSRGRCVGPFICASVSAPCWCFACCCSRHIDLFCGGYLFCANVCSTGVFSAMHWCFKYDCIKEWKHGFSSWSMVGTYFERDRFVWARAVSPHFLQGVHVYVCIHIHTHTACGVFGCEPRFGQDDWIARKKSRCTVAIAYHAVYKVHTYTYICWVTPEVEVWTDCLFVFFWHFFLWQKRKEFLTRCKQHRHLESRYIWTNRPSNKSTRLLFLSHTSNQHHRLLLGSPPEIQEFALSWSSHFAPFGG